jgi:hypothetical protein
MAKCVYCGKPAGLFAQLHPGCVPRPTPPHQTAVGDHPASTVSGQRVERPVARPPVPRFEAVRGERARENPRSGAPRSSLGVLLGIAGGLFFASGLYYLNEPALPGSEVVNYQRLAFGVTYTIVGAIFCAVVWRPR